MHTQIILEKSAKIISRIFDFYVVVPITFILVFFNVGLSVTQIKILGPLLTFLDVVLPIGFFFFLIKKGKITDIDITKRQERHLFYGFTTIILLISTLLAYFLANYQSFVFSLLFLLIMLTLFLATLKWKISGHLIVSCAAIFIINYIFGWRFIWLFSLVPFIAFARLYLKKHTIYQVLAGIIVGLAEPYIILKFFNLI